MHFKIGIGCAISTDIKLIANSSALSRSSSVDNKEEEMSLRPFIFTSDLSPSLRLACHHWLHYQYLNAAGMPDLDHQQRELSLDAQDLQALVAETGAGSLEIIGVEGLTQIKLVADIYSNDDSKVILTLEKKANKAQLKADFESHSSFSTYSPYIDLSYKCPPD